MKILVCIKQVPDDSVEISIDKETGKPNLKNVSMTVNAFDTYALEMATRLKESLGGEITVLTIGTEESNPSLKNCLAVGANKAYLIEDSNIKERDLLSVSYLLSEGIKKLEEDEKFDLIFFGKETTDITSGQLGSQISERLNRALISDVMDIEIRENTLISKQETEEGYNLVESSLPSILNVTKPNYEPRYPTIKNKMAARKMPIEIITLADLSDLDENKLNNFSSKTINLYEPAKKEAGVKIQEKTCEESIIKAMDIISKAKVL